MWRWVRKWVHLSSALIAIWFSFFCWLDTFWSAWSIGTRYSAASASAVHDWKWISDCKCAFVLSMAFFQLVNGLVTQALPVLSTVTPLPLQILQNAPRWSSLHSSQVNCCSDFGLYLHLSDIGDLERCFTDSELVQSFFAGIGCKALSVSDCAGSSWESLELWISVGV